MATAGQSQVRQQAATSGGLIVSCRAYFGFGPYGTSAAGRVRDITVAVSPAHAAAILAAKETGATDAVTTSPTRLGTRWPPGCCGTAQP